MSNCNHSHWFGLSIREDNFSFTRSNRAHTLLNNLSSPQSQKPSLFAFLGSSAKALALQELIPTTPRPEHTRGYGEVHLHIDPSSILSDRPVLFADGHLSTFYHPGKAVATGNCHESITKDFPKLRTGNLLDLQDTADHIFSRLLLPFADAFCIFASDLGGVEQVAWRLASWLTQTPPSSLPSSIRPHIIVVVESVQPETQERQLFERLLLILRQETKVDFTTHFGAICVVALPPVGTVSTQSRHQRLKDCLISASDQVRSERLISGSLLTAQHLVTSLDRALDRVGIALVQGPEGWVCRLLKVFLLVLATNYISYQRRGDKEQYFQYDDKDHPGTIHMQELQVLARPSSGSMNRLAFFIIAELSGPGSPLSLRGENDWYTLTGIITYCLRRQTLKAQTWAKPHFQDQLPVGSTFTFPSSQFGLFNGNFTQPREELLDRGKHRRLSYTEDLNVSFVTRKRGWTDSNYTVSRKRQCQSRR